MKALLKKAVFAVVFILILSFSASAFDFEAGWGKGLSNDEFSARAFLKAKAVSLCDLQDSDSEKVRKLNEFVCQSAEYDYKSESSGLADFVYKRKAVCTGYAEALSYMLDCVNIKNFKVTADVYGQDMSKTLHVWNAVYIDGGWLHVDTTWNDATISEANPSGKYFLLSGSEIFENRQKLPLVTAADYDIYYDFLKTVKVSFDVSEAGRLSFYSNTVPEKSSESTLSNAFGIRNGRLLLPVRNTVFSLGGYVNQDEQGGIKIVLGTKTMDLNIGSLKGTMDGEEFSFDTAPEVINGIVMIPVRTVFEKMGAVVSYDGDAMKVTIGFDPHINT